MHQLTRRIQVVEPFTVIPNVYVRRVGNSR